MKLLKLLIPAVLAAVLLLAIFIRVSATPVLPQPQKIDKTGTWLQNATEASGFVWNNELYYVYTDRNLSGSTTQMKIVKPTLDSNGYITGQTDISTFGSGYGCQDVNIAGNTLYIFATNCKMDFSHKGNSIVKFTSTDLTNFSSPTTIKTADANTQYYNVSATYNTSTTEYLIAYEQQNTTSGWGTKFIASYDNSNWVATGGTWSWTPPEIKYLNSSYYIWGGNGSTTGMTKTNLGTFTNSRLTVLKPEFAWEDTYTTDIDLVEFNGNTYGFYSTGDQSTYMRLTYFLFNGALDQFVTAYQQPN